MIPQGSQLFPTQTFTALTEQVNNATSCEGLQAVVTEMMPSVSAVKDALDEQLALIAPMLALLTVPTNPSALLTWAQSLITHLLTPMLKPYTDLEGQLIVVAYDMAQLTSAIAAKASEFESCTVVVPPL